MPKNQRSRIVTSKLYRQKLAEATSDVCTAVKAGISDVRELKWIVRNRVDEIPGGDVDWALTGVVLSRAKQHLRLEGWEIDDNGIVRNVENLHPEECEQIKTRREKRILGETRNLYSFAVRTGHQRDAERYRKRIEMICDELDFDPDEFLATQQELSWQSDPVESADPA